MIEVDRLEVAFGHGRGAVHAVRGVSFKVARGAAFGLVGESGSGKSTVLRALAGLVPPSAGRLAISGEARSDTSLLQFVDNLFRHPAFGDPDPTQDRRREEDDLLDFDLTVAYKPTGVPQPAIPPPPAAEPTAAGETEER